MLYRLIFPFVLAGVLFGYPNEAQALRCKCQVCTCSRDGCTCTGCTCEDDEREEEERKPDPSKKDLRWLEHEPAGPLERRAGYALLTTSDRPHSIWENANAPHRCLGTAVNSGWHEFR
jgi:hypothetical protein